MRLSLSFWGPSEGQKLTQGGPVGFQIKSGALIEMLQRGGEIQFL